MDSINTVLDVLAHSDRRHLLSIFVGSDRDSHSFDELVETVIGQYANNGETLTDDVSTRIEVALYHNHLPRLDEYGMIDFDEHSQTVEVTTQLESFEPVLESVLTSEQMNAI